MREVRLRLPKGRQHSYLLDVTVLTDTEGGSRNRTKGVKR